VSLLNERLVLPLQRIVRGRVQVLRNARSDTLARTTHRHVRL
jgi:hypothetical protein